VVGVSLRAVGLGLFLLARPSSAAACAANGVCPDYFSCLADVCVEQRLDCSPGCPPHLSCQPTTTTPINGMAEPAPSGFYCGWRTQACATSADCVSGFECVHCGPDDPNYCDDVCLPSRTPCDTHADCPEFFHCFDFAADELPSHWPPGAGRACKPLLGSPTYAPRALAGGTLIEGPTGAGTVAGAGNSTSTSGAPRDSTGCGCQAPRSHADGSWVALVLAGLLAARHSRRRGARLSAAFASPTAR
jgi:hypothetical protein